MTDGNRLRWPRGLPCPDLKAISFAPDGGELASEMEDGSRRVRRLYDTMPTTYKASLTCDRIESLIFMSFYEEVAGAEFDIEVHSPFNMTPSASLHRAQFLSLPDISEVGAGSWRISLNIWLSEVTVPAFDAIAFLAEYGAESGRIVNLIDRICNEDLPEHLGVA